MVSLKMNLMFKDMNAVLLCVILLLYSQESPGNNINTIDEKNRLHSINSDFIFLEICNQTVSQQSLQNLNTWIKYLDKKKRNDIIYFFDIIKKIKHRPIKGNSYLIKELDSILQDIGINPSIRDYIIYSIYLRQGERFADDDCFKSAYAYLERSAQNGYEKAILEWAEYNINLNTSPNNIKQCVLLLKKINSYASNTKAMILLSRITLLYCDQRLTDISLEDAFNTIFENKNCIISSSHLNTLLEAGVMCLLIPELQCERDRGIVLLKEYVDKTENIEMLLKLIYVSNSNDLRIGTISGLCLLKVNKLVDKQDSR